MIIPKSTKTKVYDSIFQGIAHAATFAAVTRSNQFSQRVLLLSSTTSTALLTAP
jgi:hypothetical protein